MDEKIIQTSFGKKIDDIITKLNWTLDHLDDEPFCGNSYRNFVFELKIEKGTSMSFDRVAEHQIINLKNASNGFYHKISDSPIFKGMKSRFTSQKPFDCLYINSAYGFVVICWYKKATLKELHFIQVEHFEYEKEHSTRKSLNYETSKQISILTYNLNAKTKNK